MSLDSWLTRTEGTPRQKGKRFQPRSGKLKGAKKSKKYKLTNAQFFFPNRNIEVQKWQGRLDELIPKLPVTFKQKPDIRLVYKEKMPKNVVARTHHTKGTISATIDIGDGFLELEPKKKDSVLIHELAHAVLYMMGRTHHHRTYEFNTIVDRLGADRVAVQETEEDRRSLSEIYWHRKMEEQKRIREEREKQPPTKEKLMFQGKQLVRVMGWTRIVQGKETFTVAKKRVESIHEIPKSATKVWVLDYDKYYRRINPKGLTISRKELEDNYAHEYT